MTVEKINMCRLVKSAVFAVCVTLSFSALAWQMGTQGLVSFTYGGKLEFFCDKPVSVKELPGGKGWTSKVYEYATPDKKLGVRVTWKFYTDFDAAEYVPELYALGNDKTLPVSNLVSFDFSLDDGTKNKYAPKTVRVRSLVGDTCNIEMFTPQTRYLERNWVGYGALGRSSDGAREWPSFDSPSQDEMFFHKRYPWFWMTPGQQGNMPYLCFDFPEGDGLDIAIGWSGTWRCECLKLKSLFRARAGLGKTNFRVLPGETLRAPSIVMFHRPKGMTPREMRTIKHRFMLAMKSPRDSKGELIAPVMANTFYGGMWTDEMMTDFIKWTKKEELPFDAFWADAGWNGKNKLNPKSWDEWQDEIGTWTANPSVHPDGNFAKVADCAHAHDAKLMLWCEPERINTNTVFAALPPECLLSWEDERAKARKNIKVLNLGTEGGLNAAVGAVEDLIRDSHIDIYRQDSNTIYFNRYWDSGDVAEGPERVGVTEMKYIAGLYKFWDTLRERHPDLLIDNCASGGRRIDIELNSRSHVYCRSDYFINHRHEDQVIAAQNAVLNTLDIQPFQASKSATAAPGDEYAFFSVMASSIDFSPTFYGYDTDKRGGIPEKELAWFKKMFGVANKMRPYYLGDFYPQTEPTGLDRDVWCAYQMHRPDLDSGFVLAFRRQECPTDTLVPSLGGLKDNVTYALASWDGQPLGTLKGAELRTRPIKVAEKRGFAMFFYSSVEETEKDLSAIPAATYENVPYGAHARQKLDVFLPERNASRPVVIYIHGGSWSTGVMVDHIVGSSIRMLLNRGVAVVAVGYRFVHETYAAGVRPPVMGCLDDCEAALRFVKDHATEWNIDVSRLGLAGGSAGACTSLYLALKDNNVHGVRALAPIIAQTSMDPQEMKAWIPNTNYGAHAFWYRDFDEWLAHRADCLPYIERISPAALARKIDPKRAPQIFLQYGAPLKPGEIAKDPTHSPAFGEHFKELCAERGIPCKVNYGGRAFFGDAFTWLADTL